MQKLKTNPNARIHCSNIPLQPTVSQLRCLPSAELARS
jgi:hypothetical protein